MHTHNLHTHVFIYTHLYKDKDVNMYIHVHMMNTWIHGDELFGIVSYNSVLLTVNWSRLVMHG